ncbi:hypothetical protein HERIO_890 [Hepatospora eriocheir]|uniref:Polyprenol reductase n=1 Tax=Hepatospora eriocheir TaxID=1081669 RepID=A0A1X0QBV2_9MICR|nr:hypothetical protein HERIO_890 [Hepatospora eriocheir]
MFLLNLYLIISILISIGFKWLFPEFLIHNRRKKTKILFPISKKYFILFYLIGSLVSFKSFFCLYTLRRLFETLLYFDKIRSSCNIFHLIHGVIYYFLLGIYFSYNNNYNNQLFIYLNILQGISHYLIYYKQCYNYSHYLIEFLIYINFFILNQTITTFLLLINVICFICLSIN